VPYGLLLGLADRFLIYALFGGNSRSLTGFIIDTYFIMLAALVSHRLTLAAQMVRQYPCSIAATCCSAGVSALHDASMSGRRRVRR